MTESLLALADALESRVAEIKALSVVAGFDGFVDEMIEVVGERQGLDSYQALPTLDQFGGLISDAAGRSSLREIVITEVAAGGCAVNLGDGIAGLGVQLDYFGTLGQPQHKAFDEFAGRCRSCTAWDCDPGRTLALEFQDGKYMLSSVSQLADFDPALLDRMLADGTFARALGQAGLLALTNWTLYPHMTACWARLQETVLQQIDHRPWLFIDLVDPRSRTTEDIRAMLAVLKGFENSCRTVFGGNLNESNVLADLLGIDRVEEEGPAVAEQAGAIRTKLGISELAIHCITGACMADADGSCWVDGPYTPTPKKSTGAGDRYNAGYCLGLLLGLPAEQRLLLGNATSGFFVRHGRSGSAPEVAAICRAWADGSLPD